ncbi:hypothetical protein GWL_09120 [Herbaspirillum sp. GW103]|nr:hypothetical protein GWL_09120 [Herbaspirillum sp. GW103]
MLSTSDLRISGVVSQKGATNLIGQDMSGLRQLVPFMRLVSTTKKQAFSVVDTPSGRTTAKEFPLGKFLVHMDSMLEVYSSRFDFSPELALFFSVLRQHEEMLENITVKNPHILSGVGNRIVADAFNDFIEKLRKGAAAEGTRKKMADRARNSSKNRKRLVKVINVLTERYARLVVVRLDLLYRSASIETGQARAEANQRLLSQQLRDQRNWLTGKAEDKSDNMARIDVGVAKADLNAFLANMRKAPAFEAMVGYAWKMEWSPWSGYHFHLVLFYNGSKVQNDYLIAKNIGERWEAVTGGRGFVNNCQVNKNQYKHIGTGILNHWDEEKRQKVIEAACYLTKAEQYVRVKPSSRHRVFQTSIVKEKGNLGRPRTRASGSLKAGAIFSGVV